MWDARFAEFCARRVAAASAPLESVRTVTDRSSLFQLQSVGDEASRREFDGSFFQSTTRSGRPSIGVVFVTSPTGDTATNNPAALGGGRVDEQLIYEGLTRVAADAVIVGSGTVHRDAFFSVWRPEFVALRASLGLPRHPVQVVLTANGSPDPDNVLLFNVPETRVIVVTSPAGAARLTESVRHRPWVRLVAGTSLERQMRELRQLGIVRACGVGGRTSVTALVDAGLVDDVYLTSAPGRAAAPGTPWYTGHRPPSLQSVLLKEWTSEQGRVTFGHGICLGS